MISKDGAGIEGTDFQIFSVFFLVSRELPTPPSKTSPYPGGRQGEIGRQKQGAVGRRIGSWFLPVWQARVMVELEVQGIPWEL